MRDLRETLSPEARLVTAGARTRPNADLGEQIREAQARKLDWALMASLAQRHGVAPLVYRSLSAISPSAAPPGTMEALQARALQVAAGNLRLTRDLLSVIALLEERGVQTIPFKGPLLAQAAYGDLTLREFCDLDVLVRKHDLQRAALALRAAGYCPSVQATGEWRQALLKPDHAQVFWADGKAASIDLHWTLTGSSFSFPVAMDRVWARQQRLCLGGREVRSLSAEDTLLLLCVHGAKHSWESLLWICDVAQFVESHAALNWELALLQARRGKAEKALLLGLALANALLQTELPAAVSRALASDKSIAPLAADVCRSLFDVDDAATTAGRQVFPLKVIQRRASKARYAWMLALRVLLPNGKDRAAVPWTTSSWLPFLVRPFRLARTYGPGLLSSRTTKNRPSTRRAA